MGWEGVGQHAEGWDFFLGRLSDVAEGRPPREPAKSDAKK